MARRSLTVDSFFVVGSGAVFHVGEGGIDDEALLRMGLVGAEQAYHGVVFKPRGCVAGKAQAVVARFGRGESVLATESAALVDQHTARFHFLRQRAG